MSDFLDARIDVPCPICGKVLHPTLGDVQNGRTVACPEGHQVRLVAGGDGIGQVDRALDELQRTNVHVDVTLNLT